MATLLAWLDRFIAPQAVAQGGERLRRLRATVAMYMLALVLYPPWLAAEVAGGHLLRAGLGMVSWGSMPVLVLLARRGVSPGWLGHGLGFALLAPTLVGVIVSDAPYTPHLMTLVAAPVALTLLSGGRVGWLWCGASMVVFGFVALRTDDTASREWILAQAMSAVSLVGVGHAFEAIRRWAFDELVVARDEARAAAKLKARFLANMSHEIRTPMNGVMGMLGVLLETRLDEVQRDCAATAHASGVMLLDLLNDILDVSKIEAGQMVLEAAPFDLRALVEDLLDQIAIEAERKGIELALRYVPGTPVEVIADRGRVRQILLNLVSNAIKYTDEGHVLVTVERADGALRCSVEDTGTGIDAAQQSLIFEEFRQVDGSTSRAHGGTGLGLTIVRDLVALMGGELGVTSARGQGSVFWFTLPLDLMPPVVSEGTAGSEPGTRVLVVDDEPICREVLCEQLTAWGVESESASSGTEALEQLRAAAAAGRSFSIALLDCYLPGMDGLELARAIEADPAVRSARVIMLVSATHRGSTQSLRDVGDAAYLKKPVHQSELRRALVAARERPEARGAKASVARSGLDPPTEAIDLRVLVVDDNVINQKVAQRMFSNLGCQVDVAGDGHEALALIESASFDMVFMDVQMPRMDGLEVTEELRRREQGSGARLPVIAMTAHAMPQDRERCLAAGMDGYISKPVTRRELLDALREHGRGGSVAAPTAVPVSRND